MLTAILVGSLLVGVTVSVHGLGTTVLLTNLQRLGISHGEATELQRFLIVSGTAAFLLVLHVLEVVLWALAYLLLPQINEVVTLEEAAYFSIVTFSTLGYGDIIVEGEWRILSGIEAINGILVIGWSTALLFAVVENLWFTSATLPNSSTARREHPEPNPTAPGETELVSHPKNPGRT